MRSNALTSARYSIGGRKMRVLAAAAAAGLLIAGTPLFAASLGLHERPAGRAAPRIAGAAGGICATGYDIRTVSLTPPDDSPLDNPPAGSITLTKKCAGAVLGHFSSEVFTQSAGDFIYLTIRATCIGTGGFADPCTVGQSLFAYPYQLIFQTNVQPHAEVNAVDAAWSGLKKGVWTFEVLPAGNNHASLYLRTFLVEAVKGG